MPEVKPLAVIDGKSLMALDVEPPKFIISRILPTGLSILSGSPKVGKSWLALWLCQQISKGEPVWEFDTLKCSVLYLALEDTVDRLHFRLSHITEDGSADSYFATKADKLKIAILLIHHTRKLPDSDPFNTISGSTGLTGSADTMFVLEEAKRTENTAVLHITGRDVQDMQINLEFNRDDMVWRFVSFASGGDNPAGNLAAAVVTFISERKSFTGTATELLDGLKSVDDSINLMPNALSRQLKELDLTLSSRHRIQQKFGKSNGERYIALSIRDDVQI